MQKGDNMKYFTVFRYIGMVIMTTLLSPLVVFMVIEWLGGKK